MQARVARWLRRNPALFGQLRRLRGRVMQWHPQAGRLPADPVTFADWRTARANIAAPQPLEYEGIAIVPAQRMVYRNQMADLRGRTSTANRWSVT